MYRLQYRNFPGDHEAWWSTTRSTPRAAPGPGRHPLVRDPRPRRHADRPTRPAPTPPTATTAGWAARPWTAGQHRGRLQRVQRHRLPSIRYAGRLASDPLNTLAPGRSDADGRGRQPVRHTKPERRRAGATTACWPWTRPTTAPSGIPRNSSRRRLSSAGTRGSPRSGFPNCSAQGRPRRCPPPPAPRPPPRRRRPPRRLLARQRDHHRGDHQQRSAPERAAGPPWRGIDLRWPGGCTVSGADMAHRHYDAYTFTNNTASPQCVTVSVDVGMQHRRDL